MISAISDSLRARVPSWLLIAIVAICFPVAAGAADKPKVGASGKPGGNVSDKMLKKESPIRIASDRMEVVQQDRTLLFEGHVVVQQDDLTLTGNRLKLFAAQGDKAAPSSMADKIDHIELEGDVKISQQDRVATAQKAVYYHQEQKIVLYGNPVVARGQDKIEGRLITIYLAQGRSVVEGGEDTPVQAILFPSRKE
jgi:lipopolysaccharide export system protein LptA